MSYLQVITFTESDLGKVQMLCEHPVISKMASYFPIVQRERKK